jgi:N6-adenosine-specific RNA methylase IME4
MVGHGRGNLERRPLPYAAMTLEQIAALPVHEITDRNARLFVWTTNRYLPAIFEIIEAWGFEYRQTLVWHKLDANMPGSVAPNSEFLLVGQRGTPGRLATLKSSVIAAHTHCAWNSKGHSRKPECFLDYIEQVSPGPYVELFARRARFGWDYWGDESLGTAEVAA